jgi:hypothetical protein
MSKIINIGLELEDTIHLLGLFDSYKRAGVKIDWQRREQVMEKIMDQIDKAVKGFEKDADRKQK